MSRSDCLKLQNQGSIMSNLRLLLEMSISEDGYADSQGYFTKTSVAEIGVNSLIITSGSRVGDETKEIIRVAGDESRNSPLQNAKARMQILRVLGLVSTDYGAEMYAITWLGNLMLQQMKREVPDFRLLRELFMGITTATEIYEHNCGIDFSCYLGYGICYALSELDYRLSSTEMPMLTTYDIRDIDAFIAEAKENRMSGKKFGPDHPHYPKTQKGRPLKQVSNLTRSINQILRVCGLIKIRQERIGTENYYVCTSEGREYVDGIRDRFPELRFLTASEFRKKNNIALQKRICIDSINALLYRSGIDESLSDTNVVFSPYQMIPESSAAWFMGGQIRRHPDNVQAKINVINSKTTLHDLRLSVIYNDKPSAPFRINNIADEIIQLHDKGISYLEIAEEICRKYETSDKNVFYPVVHEMLDIIGLECKGGVARYDAYCVYNEHMIPVEIKSPAETPAYDLKGIRQAIENKIMSYNASVKEDLAYASLVIGYHHPENDSEIRHLIEQAHNIYGINVLTCDMLTLTKMTVNRVVDQIAVGLDEMLKMHGLIIS